MAKFIIESLLSADQNVAEGLGKFPDDLYNLVDDRAGGYTPFGGSQLVTSGFSRGLGQLVGYDPYGLSTFISQQGILRYYGTDRPDTMFSRNVKAAAEGSVHIAKVGAWSSASSYYVRSSRTNDLIFDVGPSLLANPLEIEVIEDPEGEQPLEIGSYHIMGVYFIQTDSGRFYLSHTAPQRVLIRGKGQTIQVTKPADTGVEGAGIASLELFMFVGETDNLAGYVATSAATIGPSDDITFTFKGAPTGFSIGQFGRFAVPAFDPSCRLVVAHGGRMWGVAASNVKRYRRRGVATGELDITSPATVIWSEPGWVNIMGPTNYRKIDAQSSEHITGLLSTPGGLLILMDNEAHLLTGSSPPFNVRIIPGSVGCDPGVIPALHGGVAYTIWRGRLYGLSGGQTQHVGRPEWLPQHPFKQVVSEPRTRNLLIRNSEGHIFRYNPDTEFWTTNVVTNGDDPESMSDDSRTNGVLMLPSPEEEGTLYVTQSPDDYVEAELPATADEPEEEIENPIAVGSRFPFFAPSLESNLLLDYDPLAFEGSLTGQFVDRWQDAVRQEALSGTSGTRPLLIEAGHRGLPYVDFPNIIPADAQTPYPDGTRLDAGALNSYIFSGPSAAPGQFTLAFVAKFDVLEVGSNFQWFIRSSRKDPTQATNPVLYIDIAHQTTGGFDDHLALSYAPDGAGGSFATHPVSNLDDSGAEAPRVVVLTYDPTTHTVRFVGDDNPNQVNQVINGDSGVAFPTLGDPDYTLETLIGGIHTDFGLYRLMILKKLSDGDMLTLVNELVAQYRGE